MNKEFKVGDVVVLIEGESYSNDLERILAKEKHLFEVEAKYYFFHPLFLDNKKIIELLKGNLANIPISNHFLYKNTIYKIKGGEIDA